MIDEAEQLNRVIITTGGWGLAAFLMLMLAVVCWRLMKVMEARHNETNDILREVTTAMVNSSSAMNDLRDEIRRRGES